MHAQTRHEQIAATHTMIQQKNNPRKRVGGMSRKALKFTIQDDETEHAKTHNKY